MSFATLSTQQITQSLTAIPILQSTDMPMQIGEEIGTIENQQLATFSSQTTEQYHGHLTSKLQSHCQPWKQNICRYPTPHAKHLLDYSYSKTYTPTRTFLLYSQTTKVLSQSLQIQTIINALTISIYATISFEIAFKITVFSSITSPQLHKPPI